MSDYISRQAAINIVCNDECDDCPDGGCDMYRRLMRLPSADVRPVVRGTWEWNKHYGLYECSNCHNSYVDHEWVKERKLQFCPSCGADMRGEGTDFSAPLKMTTGEGNGDQRGEVPNCMNCSHRKDGVVDDFAVCECPFMGDIPKPWNTCCEQYNRGASK